MNPQNTFGLAESPLSREQLKIVIESIPANIFFKDLNCKYQIVSHLCDMLNTGGDGTIVGKTDVEVQPDRELGERYYNEDQEIIRTGKEAHYLQEMVFDDVSYYYDIAKKPVYDADGTMMGIIGLVTDMTEHVRIQRELDENSQIDHMTGALNRSYYNAVLEGEITFDFPLAVIFADCDNLKSFNDTYGHCLGDERIAMTVNNIREVIGDRGKAIRMGGDEFLLLIPNCDGAECEMIIDELHAAEASRLLKGIPLSTAYGYSIANDPSESIIDVINLADRRMYEAKALARESQLIAK